MGKQLIYIGIIVVLIASNVVFLFNRHGDELQQKLDTHKNTYPLVDSNRPLFDSEDLLVNLQPLREYMKSLPEQNQDWAELSIYFETLNSGANITVNPDLKIWPASLSKLPVAMIAMKKVQSNDWSLEEPAFTMTKEDMDLTTTPEVIKELGKTFPLEFLLERLLLESDNTAYNMIAKKLTAEEFNSLPEAVGLEELVDPEGRMSAKDYTRLLRVLYLANYLNESNSQKILGLMAKSEFNDFLGKALPSEVTFAHKWGTHNEKNVFADSGIVYAGNRKYIISVMVQAKGGDMASNQQKVENLMQDIGKHAYEYVNNASFK